MKLQRTKNATRNIAYGIMYRIIAILLPFVVRTVILYIMGADYVGLNSLFTSILSFLSLAELGVGSALVYSMYKPIAEDDNETICALLGLYKKLYRYIGTIILVIGVALIPFLKYLVKSDCPTDINLYILYVIYIFNTIISYWLFAYKQSLLIAFQRSDIISKRSMAIQLSMYVMQIIVLIIFRNYYAYIIWLPISTVITNLVNSIIVDRMFPQYKCKGKISKDLEQSIKKKVTALFGTKANAIVMHAADNIVISAFLGLTMVGKYGNYYYIMNSIIGIMTIIYNSLTAGLGNSLETESLNKNYRDFNVLSFLNSWIVMFCTTSLVVLYQPFMRIWVHEKLMFKMDMVILLGIYFYIYQIRRIVLTYKDAAGIWWEDRYRPYIMMAVNLVGNLLMVQFIGINGVVLSTIIGMLISLPWENYTVFKYIFKCSSFHYYIKLMKYICLTIICSATTWLISCIFPDGVIGLFFKAVCCIIIPNVLYWFAFRNTHEFTDTKEMIWNRYGSRIKKNRGK